MMIEKIVSTHDEDVLLPLLGIERGSFVTYKLHDDDTIYYMINWDNAIPFDTAYLSRHHEINKLETKYRTEAREIFNRYR